MGDPFSKQYQELTPLLTPLYPFTGAPHRSGADRREFLAASAPPHDEQPRCELAAGMLDRTETQTLFRRFKSRETAASR